MKISKAVCRHKALGDRQPRVCSKSPSSKATAIFARGASWHNVNTEKWRERCWRLFLTAPVLASLLR